MVAGVRRSLMVLLGLALVLGAITAAPGLNSQAANANDFKDGSIISDGVFFNGNGMTESQVQSFLNGKVSTCRSGYTCLKDYRQDTWSRAADPMCSAYQGVANESAASIIVKVGQACGVNPQVLLVLLQKEQGLVTDTWPTAYQYRSATGYGCPDTAPCDAEFYGFFNQVYKGAWALKRYTMPPGTGSGTVWTSRYDLSYPVGRTSSIYWHPNAGCGTKQVTVQNQATHSLYLYTPYTPNQAALSAGYGTGDSCSSYGNRNFFLFFTDWFGSTGHAVAPAFLSSWTASGGLSGSLGEPTSPERFDSGGRWQAFQRGVLTQRDGQGVLTVDGQMGERYLAIGAGLAGIGLPTGAVESLPGGTKQNFQRGTLYWTSQHRAWEVDSLATGTAYAAAGGPGGALGYPIGGNTCGLPRGGCYQPFQNGSIHWTASTGAHATSGEVRAYWASIGWESSFLGYPIADAVTADGVTSQAFEGGDIRVVNGTASWTPAAGPFAEVYLRTPGLGNPVGFRECRLRDGGCYQAFQNGSIHYSPTTGAHATAGAVRASWEGMGWEGGLLGYPTGDAATSAEVTTQDFEGGQVRVVSGVASYAPVAGPIRDAYLASSVEFGAPVGRQQCWLRDGGCFQEFANASIHWTSATGAHVTAGTARTYWARSGWENGPLGFPISDATTTAFGSIQKFENGTIYRLIGGGWYRVTGGIAAEYESTGAQDGFLGWPTGEPQCWLRDDGCFQDFQRGSIHFSPKSGAHATAGAMRSYWASTGWEGGSLGFPTGSAVTSAVGTVQQFQGATVYLRTSGAVQRVDRLSTGTEYARVGAETGGLGWPIASNQCWLRGSGCFQEFENGSIHWSSAYGAHATSGVLRSFWASLGWEGGVLGYPVAGAETIEGVTTQRFEGGDVRVTEGVATYLPLSGPIRDAYSASTVALGLPKGTKQCWLRDGGCFQEFANGSIHWTASTGAHVTSGAIRSYWASRGWEGGVLGYPIGEAATTDGVTTQLFQGGSVSDTNGRITFTPRS